MEKVKKCSNSEYSIHSPNFKYNQNVFWEAGETCETIVERRALSAYMVHTLHTVIKEYLKICDFQTMTEN
jgi:hypothetical protein